MRLGDDATKASLLETLHGPKPPAMLFTASHGMALRSGQAAQPAAQGALLCQDWPGFGSVRAEHFLAATDIADDANVNGVVALLFACFGAGTPEVDQFLMDLSQAGKAPQLAPQPFVAALPRRLLAERECPRRDRSYRSRLGVFDSIPQGVWSPDRHLPQQSGLDPDWRTGRARDMWAIRRQVFGAFGPAVKRDLAIGGERVTSQRPRTRNQMARTE
jgi:hypothetical protein